MTIIAQVTTSTLITAADYNEIQTKIASIIVDEYGYYTSSTSIALNGIIGSSEWTALEYDIDRCKIHQTNAETTGTSLSLSAGDIPLRASHANALIRGANESFVNMYVAHPNQLTPTVVTTTAPEGEWASNEDTFYHRWLNDADAKQFFALGGKITIGMSAGSSTGLGQLINQANLVLATKSYSAIEYNRTVPVPKNWVTISSSAGSVVATSTLLKTAELVEITTVVSVTPPEAAPVILSMNTTVTTYCSIDRGGVIPGFNALPPGIEANDAGATAVRYLSVSPIFPSQFVWPSGTPSADQVITLTNIGNVTIEISDILYSASAGVTAIPQYSWGASPQLTILVGESYIFTLAYSGTQQGGPYSNTVTIKSNNDRGDIVINTTQQINQPILDFSLSAPTSDSLAAMIPLTRQFMINANRTETPSYSASLSENTEVFTITSGSTANPISVTFTPPDVYGSNTYETTLIVTVTEEGSEPVTKTVTMTVAYTQLANASLGGWISPLATDNSVVGISYDRINQTYYLTVGIGTGADGAAQLANADLTNLGITADPSYSETIGPALYRMRQDPEHVQFLKDYGVWIRSDLGDSASIEPINSLVVRSYSFTVPQSKVYNWTFSVDNYAYFTIDGELHGNMNSRPTRSGDPRYWSRTQTSSVYLSSGTYHTIKFVMTNSGGPAGIAIRLFDPSLPSSPDYDIWSTLKPVRPTSPYLYWNQVFRIPLSSGANTYQLTQSYCVKDTGPVSWSDYFNPFISIQDNGANILSINFNQSTDIANATIRALPYSPYYYVNSADPAAASRVTNNDDGAVNGVPGQTQFFTGFSVVRAGAVPGAEIQYVTPDIRLVYPYPGYGYVAPTQDAYVYESGPGPGESGAL